MDATGITQEQLAKELDLDQSTISRIYNGKTGCSGALALQIHDRYGVALDSLVRPRRRRVRTAPAA
jgi:plasmid maintenance system antidote protein VapI